MEQTTWPKLLYQNMYSDNIWTRVTLLKLYI